MADDNVALGRRWFEEVWNQKKSESVPELLAADCVMHGISETGGDVRGPEGFLALHAKLLSAFPDMRFALDDCFGAGDNWALMRRARRSSCAAWESRGLPAAKCRKPGITGIAWRCLNRLKQR